jgi:hypothetical protein
MTITKLFENRTTNGNSSVTIALLTGGAEISVSGTFDGAKVKLQDNKTGADWADIIDIATGSALEVTAATNSVQLLPSAGPYGKTVRAVISSAGASTSLTVTAYHNA